MGCNDGSRREAPADGLEDLCMSSDDASAETATPASETTKAKSRRSWGQVTIFNAWCKGCAICIEFCPRGVFESDAQGRPVVAHPMECTACRWCDTHCPDLAITIRRVALDELQEAEEFTELADQDVLLGGVR
jgi:2-oxoglutarate ferredoxin oxidoreductase subunit delta